MQDYKIRDRETGEIISITGESDVQDLSRARRILELNIKELDSRKKMTDELLQPHIDRAIENGEKIFQDFWDLRGGSLRFSMDNLKNAPVEIQTRHKELKSELKEIEADYKKQTRNFLKFPKL